MTDNQKEFKWPDWLLNFIKNNRGNWKTADPTVYGSNAFFVNCKPLGLLSIAFTKREESDELTNINVYIYEPAILSQFPDTPDRIELTAFHPPQFSYDPYSIGDGNGVAYEKTIPGEFDISILEKYL